jgi:hypothetical protein
MYYDDERRPSTSATSFPNPGYPKLIAEYRVVDNRARIPHPRRVPTPETAESTAAISVITTVAQLRDWLDLGRNTIDSLKISDATRFYETSGRRRKDAHRRASQCNRRRPDPVRRAARTSSAVLYGLTKRLAPHRRVLFFLSWISFFVCIGSIFAQMKHPPFVTFVEIVATFLVLTLLLAMELIDKIKYRDELELARDLQAGLIPKVRRRRRRSSKWRRSTRSRIRSAEISTISFRFPTGGWRCCSAMRRGTEWRRDS